MWQHRYYVPIVISGLALPFLIGLVYSGWIGGIGCFLLAGVGRTPFSTRRFALTPSATCGESSRMGNSIRAGIVGGCPSSPLARGITIIITPFKGLPKRAVLVQFRSFKMAHFQPLCHRPRKVIAYRTISGVPYPPSPSMNLLKYAVTTSAFVTTPPRPTFMYVI